MMDDQNLNIYDFHARGYDPVIGRTLQLDPHADNYYALSPYSWVANNPLLTIDPTGMDTINVNNVDMRTFDPDVDVVGLDEVTVSVGSGSDEPADATRENIPMWLLRNGDKVMGHRDGISGLEDLFDHRKYGPYDVNAEGRIIGLTPTTGIGPDAGRGGAANVVGKIAKNAKKMSIDDIGRFLKAGKNWHKGPAKKKFLDQFKKELKGDTNADFYIDGTTKNVFLKSNKSGNWVNTGLKFE